MPVATFRIWCPTGPLLVGALEEDAMMPVLIVLLRLINIQGSSHLTDKSITPEGDSLLQSQPHSFAPATLCLACHIGWTLA